MHQRLFKYISGDNEAKKKIEMTSPVTVQTTPGQGPACTSDFLVSFFLPYKFQVTIPELLPDVIKYEMPMQSSIEPQVQHLR